MGEPPRLRPPQAHRGTHHRLTRVAVFGPRVSTLPEAINASRLLAVGQASAYRLELEWDGGASGERHDFRPTVPLLLRW